MRKLYSVPALTAALIAVSPGIATGVKDTYNSIFNRKGGIEKVVQAPNNKLEGMLGGVAYAQTEADARTYSPREEFRKLGWEVYDDPGLNKRPNRSYNTRITPAELRTNIFNPNIKANFTSDEIKLLSSILDGDLANDELRYLLISNDDYLAFAVITKNKEIGTNGIYSAQKKVSSEVANLFRQLPHLNQ